MDLLTASVQVPRLDGHGDQLAVAMIPAQSDGVSVTPFWSSFVLAGAESDQVSVDDVLVPAELLVRTEVSEGEHLDDGAAVRIAVEKLEPQQPLGGARNAGHVDLERRAVEPDEAGAVLGGRAGEREQRGPGPAAVEQRRAGDGVDEVDQERVAG